MDEIMKRMERSWGSGRFLSRFSLFVSDSSTFLLRPRPPPLTIEPLFLLKKFEFCSKLHHKQQHRWLKLIFFFARKLHLCLSLCLDASRFSWCSDANINKRIQMNANKTKWPKANGPSAGLMIPLLLCTRHANALCFVPDWTLKRSDWIFAPIKLRQADDEKQSTRCLASLDISMSGITSETQPWPGNGSMVLAGRQRFNQGDHSMRTIAAEIR